MIAKPIRPSRRVRAAARAGARLAGCTCRPDIELVQWYGDNGVHVHVHHGHGCPAAEAHRQYAIGASP